MTEHEKYASEYNKLFELCDENDLEFSMSLETYPVVMEVWDNQMKIPEVTGEGSMGELAEMRITYEDDEVTLSYTGDIVISEDVHKKLVKSFKKLTVLQMASYYRSAYGGKTE